MSAVYGGVVRGDYVMLDEGVELPDGARVHVTLEDSTNGNQAEKPLTLREWLEEARRFRSQLPETSDSVEILRKIREERATR